MGIYYRIFLPMLLLAFVLTACGGPQQPSPPAPTEPEPQPETRAELPSPELEEAPPEREAPEPEPLAFMPEVLVPDTMELLDEEGPGKLYRVGDLLVCVMEGSHREMGFQHGRLLAERVRHITKQGYMQRALYGAGYRPEYALEQANRMVRHFPPEYVEEMHGIVEGLEAAGVDDVTYEDLLIAACVGELLHHGPDAPPACSNFVVFGRWTPDGRLLHGRNLDWTITRGAQEDAVTLVWRPEGSIPFMMVTYAGAIGGVSGMNAEQITFGEMTATSPEETFDGIPLQIKMRMVVEKAATLDEAVDIIEKGPRTLGWNYVIGDGKIPDARALEVDMNTVDVFAPDDPRETPEMGHRPMPDMVRRTNHPCGPIQQRKVAMAMGPQIGLDVDDWEAAKPLARAFLHQQNTFHRYIWLGEQIEARPGAVDVEIALALLANGPVAAGNTLHSWVFDPVNNLAYIADAGIDPPLTAWKTRYTKLDLSPWF